MNFRESLLAMKKILLYFYCHCIKGTALGFNVSECDVFSRIAKQFWKRTNLKELHELIFKAGGNPGHQYSIAAESEGCVG